jgi:hypothetical protein
MQTTEIVYRDGIIWFHQVQPWQDNNEKGISSFCLSNEDGTPLNAGDYLYELYVGDELASGGIFTVVP